MDEWVLPTIDFDHCTGCGRCVEYCPTKAVELSPEGKPDIVRPKDCAYCGMCEELCPEGVIELIYEIVAISSRS